ncbi:NAD-dependent epimerase/dehydratase family protein [Actinoplanes sp. NPDC004185]
MTSGPAMVLGAGGFLGRHICAAFASAGVTVVRVSRRPSAEPGGTWAALDLAGAGSRQLSRLLATYRPAIVVNAAGVVWQDDERRMEELNGTFVRRLAGVLGSSEPPARLVHLGSVHEYGPVPPGTGIVESREPRPAGAYGRTKLEGTRGVLDAAAGGLDAVVLRVANACGPGTPPQSLLGAVAAHLARQAGAAGPPEPLRLAPLRARRDFVDVRDVAEAVLAAARAPRPDVASRVVNVARGEAVAVRYLVDRLVRLSHLPVRIEELDPPAAVRSAIEWQQADITLARTLLGWKPRRGLDESLRDTLVTAGIRPNDSEVWQ